ncbi:MAG: ECF transporter S component [Eubacteriales bacterium]|jgi:riboflavin transporter FmnP|nr:ECF transporter S component [Clostridiales bacterium]
MNTKTKNHLMKLIYSAICLALCIVLPFLTGQIPQIGQALSPMHIPALLCGFLCGPVWGAVVGAVGPVLRSAMIGMPPMFPVAVSMAFELAAYGAAAGILYKLLPKKLPYIYVSLVAAMIVGRIVGGVAKFAILGFDPEKMTIAIFYADYFAGTLPGIILHIIIIPPIVWALRRAKLLSVDVEPSADAT